MARSNLIKLGSIYLTENNLISGRRFASEVTGLEDLQMPYFGRTRINADGSPSTFLTDVHGVAIAIKIFDIETSLFTSIKTAFADSLTNDASFAYVINGDTGNFTGQALPFYNPTPIIHNGKFSGGFIKQVTLNIITT